MKRYPKLVSLSCDFIVACAAAITVTGMLSGGVIRKFTLQSCNARMVLETKQIKI